MDGILIPVIAYVMFLSIVAVGLGALGFIGFTAYKCAINKFVKHGAKACFDW